MRWLKSTTQKAWQVAVSGKPLVIPPCDTPDHKYLQVTDNEYNSIIGSTVIKSLVKTGGIMVLDQEPAELKNSVEALQGSNASLVAKNLELERRIKELEASLTGTVTNTEPGIDIEAIKEQAVAELKAEAVAELQQKQDEIDELKASKEELQKKFDKLQKKFDKLSAKEE